MLSLENPEAQGAHHDVMLQGLKGQVQSWLQRQRHQCRFSKENSNKTQRRMWFIWTKHR